MQTIDLFPFIECEARPPLCRVAPCCARPHCSAVMGASLKIHQKGSRIIEVVVVEIKYFDYVVIG